MSKPILIFDFDGTLADTHHYIVQISNRIAPEYGYDAMDWNEVDLLRDKTTKEIIDYLHVPLLKIPAILRRAKKEFLSGIEQIELHQGLSDVLRSLQAANVPMGILSSNSEQNIRIFLANHQLDMFDYVYSTTKIWAKHISLKRLMREKGFPRDQVIYIGDEVRDITAARKSNVRVAAVTWGYNSAATIRAHSPQYLLSEASDLLQFAEM